MWCQSASRVRVRCTLDAIGNGFCVANTMAAKLREMHKNFSRRSGLVLVQCKAQATVSAVSTAILFRSRVVTHQACRACGDGVGTDSYASPETQLYRRFMSDKPCLVLASAVFCLASFGGVHPAQGQTALPEGVRDDLERNAQSLRPLAITWSRSRTEPKPASALTRYFGHAPSKDELQVFSASEEAECILRENDLSVRFTYPMLIFPPGVDPKMEMKEVEGRPGFYFPQADTEVNKLREIVNRTSVIAFDGNQVIMGETKEGARDTLMKRRLEDMLQRTKSKGFPEDAVLARWRHNFLELAGFRIPRSEYEFGKFTTRSRILELADSPGAKVNSAIDESSKRVVYIDNTGGEFEFTLNPDYRHAVEHVKQYDNDQRLLNECTFFDFQLVEGGGGLYMPMRAVQRWYTLPPPSESPPQTEALFDERFEVMVLSKSIGQNADLIDPPMPGGFVTDDAVPGAEDTENGAVTYQVPADPDDLKRVVERALSDAPIGSPFRWSLILLANLGLIVVVCVLIASWRFRH